MISLSWKATSADEPWFPHKCQEGIHVEVHLIIIGVKLQEGNNGICSLGSLSYKRRALTHFPPTLFQKFHLERQVVLKPSQAQLHLFFSQTSITSSFLTSSFFFQK